MQYSMRSLFPGLSIPLFCVGAWAGSAWEKMGIPLLPQVQIAAHGRNAVAVSQYKAGYRYEDALEGWVSQGKLPGQNPLLIRGSRSAYIYDYEPGKITPWPALRGQTPWPALPASFTTVVNLDEDSLTQYCRLYTGDLLFSEKARPGWKSAVATPWGGAFGSVVLLPDIVLAGTDSGLLVSEDRGRSWEYSPGLPREPMTIVRAGSGECFAFACGGAYRSRLGRQWTPMLRAGGAAEPDLAANGSVVVSGDTIWLTASGGERQSGVLRSVDAGKTWVLHQTGLAWNWMVSDDPKIPDERAYQAHSILRSGQALWVLSNDNARPFRSIDGGRSWVRTDAGITSPSLYRLFTLWDKLYAVHTSESETSIWFFDAGLNRWNKDTGLPLKQPEVGRGVNAAVDGDTAWFTSGTELFRSVRGTGLWETLSFPLSAESGVATMGWPIEGMAALGQEVLILGRMGPGMENFHASDDGGHSWHIQRPFFPVAAFQGKRVEARRNRLVVFDPAVSRAPRLWRVFPDSIRFLDLAGDRLVVRAGGNAYSTAALDGAWRESALPDTGMEIGNFQDTLEGFTREARWISRDAGATWVSRKIGFPSPAILDMAVQDRGVWTLTENTFFRPTGTGYAEAPLINYRSQFSKMAHTGKWILFGGVNSFVEFYNENLALTRGKPGMKIPTALHGSGDFLIFAYQDGSLGVSLDGGVSQVTHSPGLGPITVLAGKPDGLWALASGHISYSSDSGKSWVGKTAPDSLILFDGKDGMLAGLTVRDSLVYSLDGGSTWIREPAPFNRAECTVLKVHGGVAYVGTRSQGVYRNALAPSVAVRYAPGQAQEGSAGPVPARRLKRQGWHFVDGMGNPRDLQGRKALP